MDPHVGFSWLWQRCKQCRRWTVIDPARLAFVAGLEVLGDIGVHARPVVTLE